MTVVTQLGNTASTNSPTPSRSIVVDVAMGSFVDLRPGGVTDHRVPLHKEFKGQGSSTAHLQMAMGRVEIAPE